MNTNSYLMLIALTVGIFIAWVLVMTYRLLLKNVIPIYRKPMEVTETKKDTIIGKRRPVCKSDQELWELENGVKPTGSFDDH